MSITIKSWAHHDSSDTFNSMPSYSSGDTVVLVCKWFWSDDPSWGHFNFLIHTYPTAWGSISGTSSNGEEAVVSYLFKCDGTEVFSPVSCSSGEEICVIVVSGGHLLDDNYDNMVVFASPDTYSGYGDSSIKKTVVVTNGYSRIGTNSLANISPDTGAFAMSIYYHDGDGFFIDNDVSPTGDGTDDFWVTIPLVLSNTNNAPYAPTMIYPNNLDANNQTSIDYQWQFNDPDVGDSQGGVQVQVSTDSTFSTVDGLDSGQYLGSDWDYFTDSPPDGVWYVRVRVWDLAGAVSPWSSSVQFYQDTVTPHIDSINISGSASTATVTWSAPYDNAPSSGLSHLSGLLEVYSGGTWSIVSGYPKTFPVNTLSDSLTGLGQYTYRYTIVVYDNAVNSSSTNMVYTPIFNQPPSDSIINLTSLGYLICSTPDIQFTVSDPDGDIVTDFRIQVSTASDFSSTVVDATKSSNASGWIYSQVASGSTQSYLLQTPLSPNTYYVRASVYDGKAWGNWSSIVSFNVQAPNWATVVNDTYKGVQEETIVDLRTKVNAVRQARGLTVKTWTDITITKHVTEVEPIHLTELRQAVQDIWTLLGFGIITWTDDAVVVHTTERRGKHWNEIRNALMAY